MTVRTHILILLLTLLTGIATHWKIFHTDLIGVHLWRQAQNQWNIRNFHRHDPNILNPRISAHNLGHEGNILRYEFPLMQWSIAQLQYVFGEAILVTRISMFLLGFMGILGFYQLVWLLYKDKVLAACGAWILSFSPMFYYYTLNPFSDIPALAAQIWMMAFTVKYYQSQNFKDLVWAAACLCLAGLFKLPYAVFGLMPLTAVLLLFYRDGRQWGLLFKSSIPLILASLPVVAWYSYAIASWESMGVLKGIFGSAGMGEIPQYIGYHLFQWLPRHLINPAGVIFFISGLVAFRRWKALSAGPSILLLAGAGIGLFYYAYEVNMIAKVHDYYLLPFLPWLHLVVVHGLHAFRKHRALKTASIPVLGLFPWVAFFLINDYFWNIDRNGYNPDWFIHKKDLQQAAPRDSLCILLNDNTGVVFAYAVDKQGYVFDRDELPPMWVEDMIIRRGARYMYSDSRIVDSSGRIRPLLDSMLLQRGSVKVFRLVGPEGLMPVR